MGFNRATAAKAEELRLVSVPGGRSPSTLGRGAKWQCTLVLLDLPPGVCDPDPVPDSSAGVPGSLASVSVASESVGDKGLALRAGEPLELGAVDPSAPAPALMYPSEGALASDALPSGLPTRARAAPREEALVPSAESVGIPRPDSGSLCFRRMPGVWGMAGEMGEKYEEGWADDALTKCGEGIGIRRGESVRPPPRIGLMGTRGGVSDGMAYSCAEGGERSLEEDLCWGKNSFSSSLERAYCLESLGGAYATGFHAPRYGNKFPRSVEHSRTARIAVLCQRNPNIDSPGFARSGESQRINWTRFQRTQCVVLQGKPSSGTFTAARKLIRRS